MEFEKPTEKIGVERIWTEAREEVLSKITEPEAREKAEELLDDENFKKTAMRAWEKLMDDTKNPEEQERQLINGLIFRVKEEVEK